MHGCTSGLLTGPCKGAGDFANLCGELMRIVFDWVAVTEFNLDYQNRDIK